MTSLDQKLAALEQRVSQLERTLRPARPAPPPEPQQVQISYPAETNSQFVAPSDTELERLHRIVISAWPNLKPVDQSFAEAHVGFVQAFLAIGHLGRTATVDNNRELLAWTTDARRWHAERGRSAYLSGNDFAMAAIAHFDVDYTLPAKWPSIGFSLSRDSSGTPATDEWKKLLERRQCRPPVEPQQVRRVS